VELLQVQTTLLEGLLGVLVGEKLGELTLLAVDAEG
jgi:hypothetical protein